MKPKWHSFLLVGLALLLVISIVACGQPLEPMPAPTPEPTPTPTTEPIPEPEIPANEPIPVEEYINRTYGYKISYPSNCELDVTQSSRIVTISLNESAGPGVVAIFVNDYEELGYMEYTEQPTEDQIDYFLSLVVDSFIVSLENDYDDLIILENTSRTGHCRILEATITEGGYNFKIFTCFQWHQNVLYKVYGQSMGDTFSEIRAIIDSFQYIEKS